MDVLWQAVRDAIALLAGGDGETYEIIFLQDVDPVAADRARSRYACFDHFDEQAYGQATALNRKEPCEDEVVAQLRELRERAAELAGRDGKVARDAQFMAEQNAQLAADAERYYRAMFRGRTSSWNLRDTHGGYARRAASPPGRRRDRGLGAQLASR